MHAFTHEGPRLWFPPKDDSVESVVARVCSLDRNLLPPVEEAEIVPLSALPQGCSDEGLLFLEGDIVVLLSSFGPRFGVSKSVSCQK